MSKKIIKDSEINESIKAKEVRLIDPVNQFSGVITKKEALKRAENAKLDLVIVDPKSEIPVCKLLDYGKFKYDLKMKQKLNKPSSKKISSKEVQIRPNIDEHDYQKKLNDVQNFIQNGNRVSVKIRVQRRARVAQTAITDMIERVKTDVAVFATINNQASDSSIREINLSPKSVS